jgi:hypothetical protein
MAADTATRNELGTGETLSSFVGEINRLFSIILDAGPVLFRKEFREKLPEAVAEAQKKLIELQNRLEDAERNPNAHFEDVEKLQAAGLTDAQLELKLESYRHAVRAFDETGTRENLEGLLDVASTLLGSLLDAFGAGSLVRELADLLKQEMGIKLSRFISSVFGRKK